MSVITDNAYFMHRLCALNELSRLGSGSLVETDAAYTRLSLNVGIIRRAEEHIAAGEDNERNRRLAEKPHELCGYRVRIEWHNPFYPLVIGEDGTIIPLYIHVD